MCIIILQYSMFALLLSVLVVSQERVFFTVMIVRLLFKNCILVTEV